MIDRDEGAAGDSPDQTSSRTLSARIEELRKPADTIAAGDIRVSPGLADIASTRVIAEIEMLLCADDELEAILHEARDMPAIHGKHCETGGRPRTRAAQPSFVAPADRRIRRASKAQEMLSVGEATAVRCILQTPDRDTRDSCRREEVPLRHSLPRPMLKT